MKNLKNIRITVTKKDIKNGIPGNTTECAVALACKRAGLKNVEVDGSGVTCDGVRQRTDSYGDPAVVRRTFKVPQKVSSFITKFDTAGSEGRKELEQLAFTLTT